MLHLKENVGSKERAHRKKYSKMVSTTLKNYVLECIGLTNIMSSKCEHFNDIPLKKWDKTAQAISVSGRSLSEGVCICKEAARQIKEEELALKSSTSYLNGGK